MNLDESIGRIPEERVATILARAAELDRTARETVGLDVIRAAALEAGINEAAVDRALAEYAAGRTVEESAAEEPAAEVPRWRRWLRKVTTPIMLGVGALALSSLLGSTGDGGEPLMVVGWLAFVTVAIRLARRIRPSRRIRGYVVSMAFMTFGTLLGLGGVEADEDYLILFMMTGVVMLVAGGLFIKLRRRNRVGQERGRHATAGELPSPVR